MQIPYLTHKLKGHSIKIKRESEKIEIVDTASKRVFLEWITIDWAESRDLDDGIWVEKNDNWYNIFVSIADVAEIIKKDSLLDQNALQKSTSVYLAHQVFSMFPEKISTDLASLNDKTKKLTLTIKINLDKNWNVINTNIFESIFYNKKRYDKQEFKNDFLDRDSELHNDLHVFYELSKKLYKNRIKSGANPDFREHVWLKIDKQEKNYGDIASFIVQEFMILANIETAKYYFKEKINAIFRVHMPEEKWNIIHPKDISKSFYSHNHGFHLWLGENFYSHFTSPIRRYVDLINHRQLKAFLRWEKETYTINEIRKLVIFINWNINSILKLEKNHNKEIWEKRVSRLFKKLEKSNYETISSIDQKNFYLILKYFLKNDIALENKNIEQEIIYRIENDLLNKKGINILKSNLKIFWEDIKYALEIKKNSEIY